VTQRDRGTAGAFGGQDRRDLARNDARGVVLRENWRADRCDQRANQNSKCPPRQECYG